MTSIWATCKQEKKFLIFLFLLSFIVRALFFQCFLSKDKNYFRPDSTVYHEVAMQIADEQGITRDDGSPNFLRVPGYPLFLGAMYKLFGVYSIKALWVQLFFVAFIPLLIFCLSLSLFPASLLLAKVSSMFSVFHLGFVLNAGLLMTESLFSLFLLLFAVLFLENFSFFFCVKSKKQRHSILFLAGVLLGIATLIRPVGHYLIVLAGIMLFLARGSFTVKLKRFGCLFIGWVLIVVWWLLRNYLLTGFVFFHTLPGHHFLKFSAVPVDVQVRECSYQESFKRLCVDAVQELQEKEEKIKRRNLSKIEKCFLEEKLARGYLKHHPVLFVKNSLVNMCKTVFGLYSSDILFILKSFPKCCYEKGVSWWDLAKRFLLPPIESNFFKVVIWLEMIMLLFVLLGFGLGLIQALFNLNLFCQFLKVLPFMGLLVGVTLAFGCARFRLPIEPFFIILALNFWLNLFRKRA